MKKDFNVKLVGVTKNPQLLSASGALGCFEEKSSAQIIDQLMALSKKERLKKEQGVLKNSFGRTHGAVGDQNYFIFSIENLPRAATFQLCLPEYLSHLQQSLRRAKATRGFHLPQSINDSRFADEVNTVLSHSFKLYEEMAGVGVPGEDARFILPLYTKTNIQTGGDAREFSHLWKMTQTQKTPSIVKSVVREIMAQIEALAPDLVKDSDHNYEILAWYPSAQLYADSNPALSELANKDKVSLIDWHSPFSKKTAEGMIEKAVTQKSEAELANLKHIHFEFLVPMSLACLHQAIRQRTWNHSLEPIYFAAKRGRGVIPPSIRRSVFCFSYRSQHHRMMQLYKRLLDAGIPIEEAIGIMPHSLKIFTLIHINGWNALHSIGKRTCVEAQWEIRKIAWDISKHILKKMPALGKWAKPQCITYGYCPEIKDCGYYKKIRD